MAVKKGKGASTAGPGVDPCRNDSSLQSPRARFPHATPIPAPYTTRPQAAKISDALSLDLHYTADEKQRAVLLTEHG